MQLKQEIMFALETFKMSFSNFFGNFIAYLDIQAKVMALSLDDFPLRISSKDCPDPDPPSLKGPLKELPELPKELPKEPPKGRLGLLG